MALRQEDRRPIVEILERTPGIPTNCQWGMFLRNHDELTLEMVTDEERDYLYNEYAKDRRMRLNVGIRRRLAPLLDNSRRRIELLHALLLSLPGSPFLYYGDEIGMGDNIYLGDRDGVRTPMQWSPDRNAGFSRADFARLYFPVIMDTVFGYQSVNVESQQRYTSSLLHWMRRMITLRKAHHVFGRGAMTFVKPENRAVFAFTRTHEGETVLCVFNLSERAQPVELDLREHAGVAPVEMLGESVFPVIREAAYQLALAPFGFYWFLLRASGE
jgi:maltose alpha-D-glucosyltransferase/alpha-amylase